MDYSENLLKTFRKLEKFRNWAEKTYNDNLDREIDESDKHHSPDYQLGEIDGENEILQNVIDTINDIFKL